MSRYSRLLGMLRAVLFLVLILPSAHPMASAAEDIRTRLHFVRPFDDRARVIKEMGKPTSERQESFLGLVCTSLNYTQRSLLSLTAEEASIRLCADRVVSVSYSTHPLINP